MKLKFSILFAALGVAQSILEGSTCSTSYGTAWDSAFPCENAFDPSFTFNLAKHLTAPGDVTF